MSSRYLTAWRSLLLLAVVRQLSIARVAAGGIDSETCVFRIRKFVVHRALEEAVQFRRQFEADIIVLCLTGGVLRSDTVPQWPVRFSQSPAGGRFWPLCH